MIEQHADQLSKKQLAIATFILHNFRYVGTHSAAEVGEQTVTSETTVIRFCYALGLKGYAHLQKEITMYLFNEAASLSTLGNFLESKKDLLQDQQLIEKAIHKDVVRISRMAKDIDVVAFNRAARKLHEAKHIYIIGAGASKFAAEWFHSTLHILRPHVSMISTDTPGMVRMMQKVDEESLAVVISQYRYTKEPVQIAEALYHAGAKVLAITDSKLAPIHPFSTVAFVLEQMEKPPIDLMPALISFLNLLMTGMMLFDPAYYEQQRVNFDEVHHHFLLDRWS